jgi:hypothetical protein
LTPSFVMDPKSNLTGVHGSQYKRSSACSI